MITPKAEFVGKPIRFDKYGELFPETSTVILETSFNSKLYSTAGQHIVDPADCCKGMFYATWEAETVAHEFKPRSVTYILYCDPDAQAGPQYGMPARFDTNRVLATESSTVIIETSFYTKLYTTAGSIVVDPADCCKGMFYATWEVETVTHGLKPRSIEYMLFCVPHVKAGEQTSKTCTDKKYELLRRPLPFSTCLFESLNIYVDNELIDYEPPQPSRSVAVAANAIPDNADKINTESYNIFLSAIGICWTETAPDTRPIYAVLQLETRPHFMVTTVLNEDDDRRTVFPANPDYAYTNVANIDKFTTEAVAWAWVRFLLRGRLRPAGLAGKCCMIYWQARVAVATMYHEIVLRDEMLNMACWPERASKFTEECTEIVRSLLYHPSPVTLCEHLQFDAVEESNSR
ncbi:hypothetical protein E5Q_03240 [Mixia osmundae IAM 14324]|uniref:Uncharacterized protein n=1 Tax=Mixia osmundae (strain CBS 9802 / IAM 14324 / JCM 22182 / KY 12970) TaxID=764103 RepID=G7E161_MIXOS|nr:hypothetical protein E5Q_03240 [Mixia osmundae IAM 14324]